MGRKSTTYRYKEYNHPGRPRHTAITRLGQLALAANTLWTLTGIGLNVTHCPGAFSRGWPLFTAITLVAVVTLIAEASIRIWPVGTKPVSLLYYTAVIGVGALAAFL